MSRDKSRKSQGSKPASHSSTIPSLSTLRIIGGSWRSRKISFRAVVGLRPTPDRVRETLFNWLSPLIVGARVLDLFSGSGALSFEALSRGAGEVVLLEQNAQAYSCLQENAALLGAGELPAQQLTLLHQDAMDFLQGPATRFDIIIVDPPYAKQLLPRCFELIRTRGWVKDQGLIYFEAERPYKTEEFPEFWQILKCQRAGKVYYHLIQVLSLLEPIDNLRGN